MLDYGTLLTWEQRVFLIVSSAQHVFSTLSFRLNFTCCHASYTITTNLCTSFYWSWKSRLLFTQPRGSSRSSHLTSQ